MFMMSSRGAKGSSKGAKGSQRESKGSSKGAIGGQREFNYPVATAQSVARAGVHQTTPGSKPPGVICESTKVEIQIGTFGKRLTPKTVDPRRQREREREREPKGVKERQGQAKSQRKPQRGKESMSQRGQREPKRVKDRQRESSRARKNE